MENKWTLIVESGISVPEKLIDWIQVVTHLVEVRHESDPQPVFIEVNINCTPNPGRIRVEFFLHSDYVRSFDFKIADDLFESDEKIKIKGSHCNNNFSGHCKMTFLFELK